MPIPRVPTSIFAFFLVLMFAFAPAVTAGEGVVEINAVCAAAGCFQGDAPGFPVTLDGSAGRSYRLTSDLDLPNGDTTGLFISGINASGLTIDLNGFTIGCIPGACSSGSGRGIDADLDSQVAPSTTRVRNGTVQGVGSDGIRLGIASTVEQVLVLGNRGQGMSLENLATVENCRVIQNRLSGIVATDRARITSSTITGNGTFGPGYSGLAVGVASLVEGNVIADNSGSGISGFESLVRDNTVYGNSPPGLPTAGIFCVSGCNIQRNTVRGNGGDGLNASDSAYGQNVITDNDGGPVSGTGARNLGGNYCAGPGVVSATCP